MACVVIKDRNRDCHATRVDGEANPETIRMLAGYLAHDVAIVDAGEHVKVGLCACNDPGTARLRDGVDYADGGIEWLYEVNSDELPATRRAGEVV